MPSVSDRQRDFMRRAARDPEYAKERGIDPAVAQKFVDEDELLEDIESGKFEQDISTESLGLKW